MALLLNSILPVQAEDKGIGMPAPDFMLPDRQGMQQSLAKARGKVVYLDFWASWCAPCKQSFPWMDSLHKRYASQGLLVIAVNLDQERAAAERFLNTIPVNFTVLYDPAGGSARAFTVSAMPHSFLIDRNGRIQAIHRGFRESDIESLEADIRKALAG